MEQEKEKRIEEVCLRILTASRHELYLHMRFLDVALSSFSYVMNSSLETIGTDGISIYYHPGYLGGLYRQGRREVNRGYLHMVLHCIFVHPWKKTTIRKKRACSQLGIPWEPDREEENLVDMLWDVACDIAVESILDGMTLHCVKKPESHERRECYRWLQERRNVLNAEGVFAALLEKKPDFLQVLRWKQEFSVDDHRVWKLRKPQSPNQNPKEQWDDIRDKMETEMETFGQDMAEGSPGFLEQIKVENKDTYDYQKFLQKFTVLREEPHLDPDSFDYVFYSYGLSLYGNMPLLEPQETREVKKIEEFAIAIDTSMSCSGELVKNFLKETYSILRKEENFFRNINIHIIQCDEKIQRDEKITNQEELERYMEQLELCGQGGTDFRPVFEYIHKLQTKGEFQHLKGLLYFTDGKGTFPSKMPSYDTAFILMQKEYEEIQVPSWAIKIYLGEEDL